MKTTEPGDREVQPILACLGVASRFRLVKALATADRCVGELAEAVGLSQSCTTRHLQALERVGLVRGRREGRRVRFSLRVEAPGLGGLLGWALSGDGVEALVAGGNVHGEWPAARSRGVSGRSPFARSRSGIRRTGSAQGAGSAPDSKAEEPSRPPGPTGDEAGRDLATVAPAPAPRPGDLEDYLL